MPNAYYFGAVLFYFYRAFNLRDREAAVHHMYRWGARPNVIYLLRHLTGPLLIFTGGGI